MIVIDRNRCVGCGHCTAIRISLKCIKEQDGYELYEEPPEADMGFIERSMAECWAHCIDLVK
ncbi:MAG: ferredoxin [Firmicutes bacterium]|nr:ferredoxin [Bacillota bacterium]